MRIQYEVEQAKGVYGTQIGLSINGKHIGSVWGVVYINKGDKFEQDNNIIHIQNGDVCIATFWGAEEIQH